MKYLVSSALILLASSAMAADKEAPLYELRIYYAADGKLDELLKRFRDHTCKFFEKHGMTNIGYWVPIENPESKLVYVIAHKNREAADQSWRALFADEDVRKAFQASEVNGRLVKKFERMYLTPTDYSPEVKLSASGDERVFELRTYTASDGNLDALNARFRDHTLKLFTKHGMTNLWYWVPAKGEKNADKTLVYMLAHKSVDAAKESFKNFREDPAWKEAREASEKKAGGSLTVPMGVKSEFLKPTDFSPIK